MKPNTLSDSYLTRLSSCTHFNRKSNFIPGLKHWVFIRQQDKKTGLVIRGIRYREGMSQKKLAEKSGVNQTEISKIENGKRTVGTVVAKRLAKALKIDYRLLTEVV